MHARQTEQRIDAYLPGSGSKNFPSAKPAVGSFSTRSSSQKYHLDRDRVLFGDLEGDDADADADGDGDAAGLCLR